MPRPTDRDRVLRALSKAGGGLTNDQVKSALGLQPARYDAVKAQLLQEELIEKQRTRGGGIRLTKKGEQEVTSNGEKDQRSDSVPVFAKTMAIDAIAMGNDADRTILLELLEEIRASKSLPKLDSFRSHGNDGSERAFGIVERRIAVCNELRRKKMIGLRLDRYYLTAAALQLWDTVEARKVLALCDSIVNVLKAHYPQRTTWSSLELSHEIGNSDELTAHALTVLQQAPGIVVDNSKRPESGFVPGISVDEDVFSARPLLEGRGVAAQQVPTAPASSEPKSSHPVEQSTTPPEESTIAGEKSNASTRMAKARWVSMAAAVVVFTVGAAGHWARAPSPVRSCPDSLGQQAVPYRDGTICVTHAFAEFLACLEMNKLEEIAKGAKTTIGGEGTVKKGQAEATVKAEESAVGDVKVKYTSGSDAKVVATCICKYEGNCESRLSSGDAAAPIQISAPQSELGRNGGTPNPVSFDCTTARILPDFAPGAVQFDVGEFGKPDAASFELRRLKNLLTTEKNAQLWQNATKVLERNSRDGTTWIVAMVNVHPSKEVPFCAWLKCLGWKQCHQSPNP